MRATDRRSFGEEVNKRISARISSGRWMNWDTRSFSSVLEGSRPCGRSDEESKSNFRLFAARLLGVLPAATGGWFF